MPHFCSETNSLHGLKCSVAPIYTSDTLPPILMYFHSCSVYVMVVVNHISSFSSGDVVF